MKLFNSRPAAGSPRPRTPLVATLLVLTLAFTAVLAYEAFDAARSHRATAESVLREYAEFAAAEFAGRASQELVYYGFYPTFRHLAAVGADQLSVPLPDIEEFRTDAKEEDLRSLSLVQYFFRTTLDGGGVTTSDRRVDSWLADTLSAHLPFAVEAEWPLALVAGGRDETPRMLVYRLTLGHGGRAPTAWGFEIDTTSLRSFLDAAANRSPLLPPTLTGGVAYDSLVSIRMSDAAGRELYATSMQYTPTFAANHVVDDQFGALTIQVALRPDVAGKLVIGGLPSSRLPVIATLLLLTIGLVIAAILQLRREQELARLRTEFVSNVSHELRTPLAQIRMFAETLLLGRVRSDEERGRSLEVIDKEARRLTHLVENVLLFSRMERRVAQLTMEPTRLGDAVREVIDLFSPLAESRGVQFILIIDDRIEAVVDRGAVQQMVLNLLDNAVKYGPPDQTVRVGVEMKGAGVRLWVDDQGPGIPRDDRMRIWERFSRLARERHAAIAGTGIGLSVVRDLVSLHGGNAWMEQAEGGGARFVIELPNARRVTEDASSDRTHRLAGLPAPTPRMAE